MKSSRSRKTQSNPQNERPLLFMQAQLPFNQEDLVELNAPRAPMMDDKMNLKIVQKNLRDLGVTREVLSSDAVFMEIGAGRGYLLDHLTASGKGLYMGIEPIKTEAMEAIAAMEKYTEGFRQRLSDIPVITPRKRKSPVWHATLEQLKVREESLTHIYSYHVIEHLENPLLLLERGMSWLRPGGKMIITCPNVEGAYAQQNFASWRCTIRAHRWLPGITTLVRAGEAVGYKLDNVFSYGGHPRPRTWTQSLANAYYKWQNKGDVLCLMFHKP